MERDLRGRRFYHFVTGRKQGGVEGWLRCPDGEESVAVAADGSMMMIFIFRDPVSNSLFYGLTMKIR